MISALLHLSPSTGWLQGEGRAETGIEELNLSWEPGRGCSWAGRPGRRRCLDEAALGGPELVSCLGNEVWPRRRSADWNFPTAPPCSPGPGGAARWRRSRGDARNPEPARGLSPRLHICELKWKKRHIVLKEGGRVPRRTFLSLHPACPEG